MMESIGLGLPRLKNPMRKGCPPSFSNHWTNLKHRLGHSDVICTRKTRIVETDWRLFVTLVRFDAVYHGHFKCNRRDGFVDYPNLFGYLKGSVSMQEGFPETVNFDHIKRHYYITHDDINPTGIVPLGPVQDLLAPHGRERLSE